MLDIHIEYILMLQKTLLLLAGDSSYFGDYWVLRQMLELIWQKTFCEDLRILLYKCSINLNLNRLHLSVTQIRIRSTKRSATL